MEALREYERRVIPVLKDYDGTLLSAFAPRKVDGAPGPDEIHLLRFKSEKDFNAYRNDSRVVSLTFERARAIAGAIVYLSDESIDYELSGA